MTIPEQILDAVRLLTSKGKIRFSRVDIRDTLQIPRDVFEASYNPIIQGMRLDQPGGAPAVARKYRYVFQQVERGLYELTEHGIDIIRERRIPGGAMAGTPNTAEGLNAQESDPKPAEKDTLAIERERKLREEVGRWEQGLEIALYQLAQFYQKSQRYLLALETVKHIEALPPNPERKARALLSMGQSSVDMEYYAEAIDYFRQALQLKPTEEDTWYWTNFYLGYSLNQLERFQEAESYCQVAIDNGLLSYDSLTNLGISLEGQGKIGEAASSYIRAIEKVPNGNRALNYLRRLLERNPLLLRRNPALLAELKNCHDTVPVLRAIITKLLELYG